jgi:predicted protein tyrosine phosphatase
MFLLGDDFATRSRLVGPARIRTLDMQLIDDLFEMGSGYVLNFSDRTFAHFFAEELGIEIDDRKYTADGTSKAKRLRCLLKQSDAGERVRILSALWEYRLAQQRRPGVRESISTAESDFRQLIARLGAGHQTSTTSTPVPAGDRRVFASLKARLVAISQFDPQPRGYAYETFLKELFDAYGLSGRASFRLVGEQIDGSFDLWGQTYLLEAKWKGLRTAAADLRAFNAKLEDKSAWTRGLFVSESGFSEEGLVAFGRGKRVICMDGLDLHDMLDRELSLVELLSKKARHLAETGEPFIRVRDLK